MITARPIRWCQRVFIAIVQRALRRRFFNILATAPPDLDLTRPTLLLPNHSNWWDGFLGYWLVWRWTGRYPCVMMGEPEMRNVPFFRYLGAFSVKYGFGQSAGVSLRHAARQLAHPGTWLLLFPGGHYPALAPIRVAPGAAWLWQRQPEVQVVTAAFRYVFLYESRPQILISAERLAGVSPDASLEMRSELIESSLRSQLAGLDARFAKCELTGMKPILSGCPSLNRRWARFTQRLKGWSKNRQSPGE